MDANDNQKQEPTVDVSNYVEQYQKINNTLLNYTNQMMKELILEPNNYFLKQMVENILKTRIDIARLNLDLVNSMDFNHLESAQNYVLQVMQEMEMRLEEIDMEEEEENRKVV